MKNLGRALGFFRADGPLIAGALGLLLLSTAANLLKPWPLALIVDSVLGDKPLPGWLAERVADASKPLLLGVLAGAVLVVHLGQGALSAWQNFLTIKIGLRGLARVREQLFHWLQRLSLRFYQGTNTGDVIYRASWDSYAFQTLFQHGLFTGLGATLSLGCMVVVMARLNGLLTLVALGTVPLLLLAMKSFGRTMRTRSLAAHQTDSQVTSFIQQGIAALPLTQSYTREEHEERRFAGHVAGAYEKRLSQHGSEVLYLAAMAIIFGLGTAGIIGLGAGQVLAGQLTVGQLLIFLAYLGQLYEPLNQLAHIGATVSDASAGTQRVFELFDAAEEVKEAADARPVRSPKSEVQSSKGGTSNIEHRTSNVEVSQAAGEGRAKEALVVQGELRFEGVSFGYQKDRLVLRGVSFAVAAGEAVAIVGPSGAGKTTLLQLLPRFYDPSQGVVRLDGADLRELRLKDLRAHVAFVMQEPILLPATVAENIAYGRPEASRAEIEAAARAAPSSRTRPCSCSTSRPARSTRKARRSWSPASPS